VAERILKRIAARTWRTHGQFPDHGVGIAEAKVIIYGCIGASQPTVKSINKIVGSQKG
jgi:hypothetical protein